MHQLTDLIVDRVSFVDRAAVRDPSDPTKPRRLLLTKSEGREGNVERVLWKSEGPIHTLRAPQEVQDDNDKAYVPQQPASPTPPEKVNEVKLRQGEPMTPAEQLAYLRATNPHAAAIYEQQHPTSDDEDGEVRLTKAIAKTSATLAKCDPQTPTYKRVETLKFASKLACERELLAKHNPGEADKWQKTWGRFHGVAA